MKHIVNMLSSSASRAELFLLTVPIEKCSVMIRKNKMNDLQLSIVLLLNTNRKGQHMGHEDDVVIIRKALTGDDDAFAHLFQRYYSFVFKYLLKLTLDEEISRDLTQETMLKCYTHLSSFQGEGKFSTWMISIASRLYIDLTRKQKRERKWIEQLKRTLSRQLSWQAAMKGIDWSDMFAEFNQLEPGVRVPILLHHYYGYTYEEIGEMIGLKVGTVKSRVHNGLKQLRKEWDNEKK